ncbi:MAG: helix-turn-helix domain-containing protein [Boseongicola sp.]|nr:MAG: helix-turn-helix domain-containing protein [Boseongicola sp.]
MLKKSDSPIHLAVVVTPSFNCFATMGFIDPFRAANYLEGSQLFRWSFVSEAGGICYASNGIGVESAPITVMQKTTPDIAVISSSWTPERHGSKKILFCLREWSKKKAKIAGLDTGAFIMAQSGLLKGRRATVHYEHVDAFEELYPNVEVVEELFVLDDRFLSCCGGTASVDFGLHILQGISGPALANRAARYIFQPKLRERGDWQQPVVAEPTGATVPALVKRVIQTMEDNLETPLSIPEICDSVGFSHRQVSRLFAKHIKKPPANYYLDIRLDRARGLVTQTEMSMLEISVASGFSSQVHFSRAYKERFGLPPIKDRSEGRIPFEFRAWPMYRKKREITPKAKKDNQKAK